MPKGIKGFQKGYVPTKEHREKVRQKTIERLKNGLPEDQKKKISKTLSGRQFSSKHCENLSLALIGIKKGPLTENHKEKIRQANIIAIKKAYQEDKKMGFQKGHTINLNRKRSEKTRKIISKTKLGHPMYHARKECYITKNGTKIWMRSSWEVKFAEWLDKQNFTWKYETKRFWLKDRTYLPDFWIKEWNCWVEVKGWFDEYAQKTIKQFRDNKPNEKLLVLTKPLLKSLNVQIS